MLPTFLPLSSPNRRRTPGAVTRKAFLRVEELESLTLLSASALVNLPALTAVPFAPRANNGPVFGLTPDQVRHAYGFDRINFGNGTAADGSGQTIAIVDAYDDPNIGKDLHVFDQAFGLPDPPSFLKASVPGTPADAGWSEEIALDVEWAHAIAPKANLLLVEAPSSSLADLLRAVDFARQQPGVVAVSMSWGGSEFAGETSYDHYFMTPAGHIGGSGLPGGITFVAASGDNGAWNGAEWPAASPNVLAVGGTRLALDGQGNYQSESGWSGSGGGFSSFETQPGYQDQVQRSGVRTVPDVAFEADPRSGFAVYDSFTSGNERGGGWLVVGGTSAGAPQWAGLIALADQGRALHGQGSLSNAQAAIYGLPAADFHNVVSGSNGYRAGAGYNLVTGRGSPKADLIVQNLAGGSTAAVTTITLPQTATAVEKKTTRRPRPSNMTEPTSPPVQVVPTPTLPDARDLALLLLRSQAQQATLVFSPAASPAIPAVQPVTPVPAVPVTPLNIAPIRIESGGGDNRPIADDDDDGPPPPAGVEKTPATESGKKIRRAPAAPDQTTAVQAIDACFAAAAEEAPLREDGSRTVLVEAGPQQDLAVTAAVLAVVLGGYAVNPRRESGNLRRGTPWGKVLKKV
jgi:hypothetical protein